MGATVPIFFMPIDPALSGTVDSWDTAWPHLEPNFEGTTVLPPLHMAMSRNWWHLQLAEDTARRLDVSGLEFLSLERICLATDQIGAAIRGVTNLLEHAQADDATDDSMRDVDKAFVQIESETSGDEITVRDAPLRAYREARPKQQIDVTSDGGYLAHVDYLCFLKSLLASLVEALIDGKHFLYVRCPS